MNPRVHDGRHVHFVVDHVTLMSLLIDHLQQLAAIGRAVLAEMFSIQSTDLYAKSSALGSQCQGSIPTEDEPHTTNNSTRQ